MTGCNKKLPIDVASEVTVIRKVRLAPVVKLLFLSEKHAQNLLMAEFDDW